MLIRILTNMIKKPFLNNYKVLFHFKDIDTLLNISEIIIFSHYKKLLYASMQAIHVYPHFQSY